MNEEQQIKITRWIKFKKWMWVFLNLHMTLLAQGSMRDFIKRHTESVDELKKEIAFLLEKNQEKEEDIEKLNIAIKSLNNTLTIIGKIQKGEIKP